MSLITICWEIWFLTLRRGCRRRVGVRHEPHGDPRPGGRRRLVRQGHRTGAARRAGGPAAASAPGLPARDVARAPAAPGARARARRWLGLRRPARPDPIDAARRHRADRGRRRGGGTRRTVGRGGLGGTGRRCAAAGGIARGGEHGRGRALRGVPGGAGARAWRAGAGPLLRRARPGDRVGGDRWAHVLCAVGRRLALGDRGADADDRLDRPRAARRPARRAARSPHGQGGQCRRPAGRRPSWCPGGCLRRGVRAPGRAVGPGGHRGHPRRAVPGLPVARLGVRPRQRLAAAGPGGQQPGEAGGAHGRRPGDGPPPGSLPLRPGAS